MTRRGQHRIGARAGPVSSRAGVAGVIAPLIVWAAVIALGGCAGIAEQPAARSATAGPPPPHARFNLTGYPPAFRAGFDAGCEAARRQNGKAPAPGPSAADPQYRQGWKDGASICKAR